MLAPTAAAAASAGGGSTAGVRTPTADAMRRERRGSELPFPVAVLVTRVRKMQARLRADGPRDRTEGPSDRLRRRHRLSPELERRTDLALRPGEPTLLRPGMTFHVVPTVFGAGIGMCLSETVAVTERGVEVVTRFPRELITV